MKAAWIRNFWTKTVAFLLAAVLVPVILTYVVGLAYSYGGMGRDFYTSDLCLTAVGKKTWEICDDYIAMEGGNYDFDKIYSKGDSYSNIRFRVTDEQDKVEFSNVSDGDTFCYIVNNAGPRPRRRGSRARPPSRPRRLRRPPRRPCAVSPCA